MDRGRGIGIITTGLLALALSGCVGGAGSDASGGGAGRTSHAGGSSSTGGTAPSGPGVGGGTVSYAGGSATWGSAVCSIVSDELIALNAPDPDVTDGLPAMTYGVSGGEQQATFTDADDHVYLKMRSLNGATVRKKADTWSVTFAGSKLGDTKLGDPIALTGTVICSRIESIP